MTEHATGYDLAAAIHPESYHLTYDAADVAYAFRMDDEARRQLAECVRASAPSHRDIEGFRATENHLRIRVDPTRKGQPEPIGDWDGVLQAGVELYNERHATAGLDELHLGETFIGFYRLDAPSAAEWIESATGRPPDEHETVFEYTNPEDPPAQNNRWLTWRVLWLVDQSTFETPEPSGYDIPNRPGFEHDIPAWEKTVEGLVDWPAGTGELQRVAVHDEWIQADIYSGAYGSPPGYARGVRRAVLQYNSHRDGTVKVGRATVSRPALKLAGDHYVGPIDTDAVDEWLAGLPALDGEPIQPEPEPEPEPTAEPEGRLSGLNPFGGSR